MCLLFRYQDRYRFGCSAHTRALASQSTRSAPADCTTVVWFPAPWAWCALKLMSAWRSQSSRSPYRSCGEISTADRAVCGHGSRPAASPDGKPNVRLVIATEGSTRPPACQASGASEGIVDALDSAVGYVQAEGREKVEGRPSGWATGYVPAEGGVSGSDSSRAQTVGATDSQGPDPAWAGAAAPPLALSRSLHCSTLWDTRKRGPSPRSVPRHGWRERHPAPTRSVCGAARCPRRPGASSSCSCSSSSSLLQARRPPSSPPRSSLTSIYPGLSRNPQYKTGRCSRGGIRVGC